jgi:hypothetical protein
LLYIGWQGGDGVLNVISSSDGVNFGNQQELSSYVSTCSPALAASSTVIYIAYCSGGNVEVISSTNGVNWSSPVAPPYSGTINTPALAVYGSELVIAFVSNDYIVSGSVSTLLYSTPATSALGDWTLNWANEANSDGGPALAPISEYLYMGEFDTIAYPAVSSFQTNSSGLIADTGSEPVPGTVTSLTNPAMAAFNGHLFFAWKGTDNPAHLNIAEVF